MELIIVKNQLEGGKAGLKLLSQAMQNGAKTLGLATGSTPVEFYNQVVNSSLDFSEMTSVNLDEYVGLDGSNEQSYRYFMNKHLYDEKPFKENFLPNGKALDLDAEVKAYDQVIANHPIDWQILGIGQNGHIGFNEPGTKETVTTHVVDLTPSTIKANARFFENEAEVPKQAISMGLATIMKTKEIVLMAYGKEKAQALKGMIEGEVSIDLPASLLKKHPHVTVIADEAAASLLNQ